MGWYLYFLMGLKYRTPTLLCQCTTHPTLTWFALDKVVEGKEIVFHTLVCRALNPK